VTGPRSYALSVRLTPPEAAAWRAAAARSAGSSRVAWWVRAVVADVLAQPPEASRPWALARAVAVLPSEVAAITEACAGLNVETRRSHVVGEVEPAVLVWVRAVVDRVEMASTRVEVVARLAAASLRSAPGVATEPRRAVSGHQSVLVLVRLSDAERAAWVAAAGVDGYDKVSAWVRRLIGMRLGWEVPAPVASRRSGLVEVHRQIGGALANASQMSNLAADGGDVAKAEAIATVAERIVAARLALGRAPR